MSATIVEVSVPPELGLVCESCGAPGSITLCQERHDGHLLAIRVVLCAECNEPCGTDPDSEPRDFDPREQPYDSRA